MKIFGFLVDQSKRLMALVIVLVLLASAVGVVSGYESGGGCIAYLDADPNSITADGKSTSIMYFKAWCPGKYRFSAVPSIGTIKLEFPQIVPGRPSYATYTAPTTQELEDYKGVTITFYLKDDKDPNVIIESKSVTISLVPEEAVENCENYCKEKFDKEQPAFMRLFNSRGEYPFCICECIDERTGESVLCWGKDWDCEKYCTETRGKNFISDGSSWPNCQCICKKGFEEQKDGTCKSCADICQNMQGALKGYDKGKSRPNDCVCLCDEKNWWVWDDDGQKCDCPEHTHQQGSRCVCDEGWEPRLSKIGCRECPKHSHSSGQNNEECKLDVGYKWKNDKREECVCDESAGYFWNMDKSDCLKVFGPKDGYSNAQKLIDELAGKGGKGYTFETLKPGTSFSSSSYPPGTIVLWYLNGNIYVHSSMIIDNDGLQIEMGKQVGIFTSTPIPIQVGEYVPAAVLKPPPGTKVKFPKMMNLIGMTRYKGSGWTCHGFMRSIKKYVSIPDPHAALPTKVKKRAGTTKIIMKDPPGIPLTLDLKKGAIYAEGLEVDIFVPNGFVEFTREFLIEVNDDGSSQIYVFDGEANYYSDKKEASVVLIYPSQMVTVQEGLPSEPTSFDHDSLDQWWERIELSPETSQEKEGLTFESRSKPSGSSVQIPLTLSGIKDKIGNMDITLNYDPSVLEATAVTKGDLTSDSLFEYNILAGTILISLADADGFSGNGSIAYVTFNVIGATVSSSPLQIAALAANRADDYEALTIPTNDGVFRLIFISTEESGGLTVSVSDTTGAKGSTVEVPINLEGASEVGSMDIVLTYDADVLSAVDVEAGALGKNALIESNTARDGEVIIALADSSGINGDGAVASVAFKVIGDVGTTSYLTLEDVLVHNLDLAEIIPTTKSGMFSAI